jgi:type II secretory pathway component PulF
MHLTFAAGGDVVEAVELARRAGALPDRRDAEALLRAAASGAPIAPIVARRGLLPSHLAGRLAAAERAGDVAGALPAIAAALQLRRAAAVEAAPRAVATATTCAVGGALLWFALAVVIPALTAVAGAPGGGL